jgi:hypothetical protein
MQRREECKSPGNISASVYQSSLSKVEVEDGDEQAGDIDREMEENADIIFCNILKSIVKREFPITTPPLLVLNGLRCRVASLVPPPWPIRCLRLLTIEKDVRGSLFGWKL